jgi:L-malate glycosyltransferase
LRIYSTKRILLNEKLKILIIDNSTDVTGALKSIVNSCTDLSDSFEFKFVIPRKSKAKEFIVRSGFTETLELPLIELSKKLVSVFLYFPVLILNSFKIVRVFKSEGFSLIHVNDLYNLLPVVPNLLGIRIPYVCHVRFLPSKFPGWLFKIWLKLHLTFASKVIVVSRVLEKQLPSNPKITLIYDRLPLNERYPAYVKQDSGTPIFKFLYLSNFIQGKGQNYALEAFYRIHALIPGWHLRFVGGDMGLKKNSLYRDSLVKRAEHMGINHKIEWVEFTNDVELEYKMADIVLNFSESESFSMTCLEALYYGRPLIASDSGGPSEILAGGQLGILVPNGDVNVMADSMEKLARNSNDRDRMSKRAREVTRERFNNDLASKQLKNLYLS